MTDWRHDGVKYEHKGYTQIVIQPPKHLITAEAMWHIKEFIRKTRELKFMDDWRLTKRQNQIIALMADGLDVDEIAEKLEIGVTSINTQIYGADGIYERYALEGKNKHTKAVLEFLKQSGRIK